MPKPSKKTKEKPPIALLPKDRPLVRRTIAPIAGAGNIVVVKRGEDLRKFIVSKYEMMARDEQTVMFYFDRVVSDNTYSETKEWAAHHKLAQGYALSDGVQMPQHYKARMAKLKTWIEYFEPGKDYELTVDEVVEIST